MLWCIVTLVLSQMLNGLTGRAKVSTDQERALRRYLTACCMFPTEWTHMCQDCAGQDLPLKCLLAAYSI